MLFRFCISSTYEKGPDFSNVVFDDQGIFPE
jgi:hypothetical protein